MIYISTVEFDLDGFLAIKPGSSTDLGTHKRRANRVTTLDGGAVTNDFGFSDSDRSFVISLFPTQDQDAKLKRMVRYHKRVKVSMSEGFFECLMEYKPGKTDAQVSLQVIKRLDGDS